MRVPAEGADEEMTENAVTFAEERSIAAPDYVPPSLVPFAIFVGHVAIFVSFLILLLFWFDDGSIWLGAVIFIGLISASWSMADIIIGEPDDRLVAPLVTRKQG
jgi:hypothetical protein